jgi:hypothetical protein
MYKLELFTQVRSPYIWQTRKRANAPDIVNRQPESIDMLTAVTGDIYTIISMNKMY